MHEPRNDRLQEEMNATLSQIDRRRTTCSLQGKQGETIRLITVDIIDVPIEQMEPEADNIVDAPEETTPPEIRATRRQWRVTLPLIACLCLLCTGVLVTVLSVLPALAPTVSVTIVPISQQINVTSSVTIVTGLADTTKQQISGRSLAAIIMSQAKTVPTRGKGHQDAQPAWGHHLLQ